MLMPWLSTPKALEFPVAEDEGPISYVWSDVDMQHDQVFVIGPADRPVQYRQTIQDERDREYVIPPVIG